MHGLAEDDPAGTMSTVAMSTIVFDRVMGSLNSSITPVDSLQDDYDEYDGDKGKEEDEKEMMEYESPVSPISGQTDEERGVAEWTPTKREVDTIVEVPGT